MYGTTGNLLEVPAVPFHRGARCPCGCASTLVDGPTQALVASEGREGGLTKLKTKFDCDAVRRKFEFMSKK